VGGPHQREGGGHGHDDDHEWRETLHACSLWRCQGL
jgi:hypothetical protein